MEYNLGDVVRTKKQHPCGSKLWEITRVGVDFKLKCQGCGHVVMLPREKALKAITKKIEQGKTWGLPFTYMFGVKSKEAYCLLFSLDAVFGVSQSFFFSFFRVFAWCDLNSLDLLYMCASIAESSYWLTSIYLIIY